MGMVQRMCPPSCPTLCDPVALVPGRNNPSQGEAHSAAIPAETEQHPRVLAPMSSACLLPAEKTLAKD